MGYKNVTVGIQHFLKHVYNDSMSCQLILFIYCRGPNGKGIITLDSIRRMSGTEQGKKNSFSHVEPALLIRRCMYAHFLVEVVLTHPWLQNTQHVPTIFLLFWTNLSLQIMMLCQILSAKWSTSLMIFHFQPLVFFLI